MSTNRNSERYAIETLRRYSADDSIDKDRLETLLVAQANGNRALFQSECVKVLPTYCACDIFIDDIFCQAKAGTLA